VLSATAGKEKGEHILHLLVAQCSLGTSHTPRLRSELKESRPGPKRRVGA